MLHLSPDQAMRYTRIGVAGVVVAALFAVGVFLIPLPEADAPDPEPSVRIGEQRPRQTGAADESREYAQSFTDWAEAAARLAWAGPEPTDPVIASENADEGEGDEPEETEVELAQGDGEALEPAPPNWRYLGAIFSPNVTEALVSVDGRQRIVAPGERVATGTGDPSQVYEVAEIDEQRIVITQGRRRFEVDRAEPKPVVLLRGAANFDARERLRNMSRSGVERSTRVRPEQPSPEDARDAAQQARERARLLRETEQRKRDYRPTSPFGSPRQQPDQPADDPKDDDDGGSEADA
jgi:hypothetical protein